MPFVLEEGRHVLELRPTGIGRWITAGFLVFWLAGWAVGEFFGVGTLLALLGAGFGATLHGWPRVPTGPGALAMAAFLLLWTSFWTLGGIAAAATVLRSLWGTDRIEVDGTGVRHVSRVGSLERSHFYPREDLRAVAIRRTGVALETARGAISLTGFGTRQDHEAIRTEIERALGLGERPAAAAELPKGWESAVDLEGIPVLQKSTTVRRRQAIFVSALFLALATVAGLLLGGAASGSNAPSWVPSLVMSLLAAAVGVGAAWLWLGGEAIRLRHGEADVLRWFGSRRWLVHYASASIHLEHSVDSDGDDWYKLVLRGSAGARTIAHTLRDSYGLEQVGRWMAARLGCELQMTSQRMRVSAA